MGECSAEIGAVDGPVSCGLWRIEIFASAAIELDRFLVGDVGETYRQERLLGAENARTATKIGSFVFLQLLLWGLKGS